MKTISRAFTLYTAILAMALVLTGCEFNFQDKDGAKIATASGEVFRDTASTDGESDGTAAGGNGRVAPEGLTSPEAFARTVYPLAQRYCAACHTATFRPFFADGDIDVAHSEITMQQKVDFNNPAASRMVLRLSQDAHNCWSGPTGCSNDAREMLEAIEDWIILMQQPQASNDSGSGDNTADNGGNTNGSGINDGNGGNTGGSTPPQVLVTNQIPINIQDLGNMFVDGILWLEAESGDPAAPFEVMNSNDASEGQYIISPNGTGFNQDPNSADAGLASYTFDVPADGTYYVWGRVLSPSGSDNSFFIRMDNDPAEAWGTPVGNEFQWDRVNMDNGGADRSFNLTAGTHTLYVIQREDGTLLDKLLITDDPNYVPTGMGGDANSAGAKLTWDVSALAGVPNTFFEVELTLFDAFSYRVTNPQIITQGAQVYVKDIKLLINNKYSINNATYTYVDTMVNAPGAVVSSAAMIMVKDMDEATDMFSVQFGHIGSQPAPDMMAGGTMPAGGNTPPPTNNTPPPTNNNGCNNLASFQSNVKPIFDMKCANCHNSNLQYNVTLADSVVCADTKMKFTDLANPLMSLVIQKPLNANPFHGGGNNLIDNLDVAAIERWIADEVAGN